jgi:phosphoserine phosphatase RsbU/P
MKGLFARMCADPDLPLFLAECNRTLGAIRLDRMYMALGLLRLQGGEGRAVAAAMPPIFVHRRGSGRIEQIVVRGVMLGAAFDLPYEEVRFAVQPGDTLLLVSDGYLEQLSPREEMLDNERCAAWFAEAVGRPAQAVIDHLLARFDGWRGGAEQADDVTIVVLEVKG